MQRSSQFVVDVDRSMIERLVQSYEDEAPEIIETHISWLLIVGDWVYKIKKPVYLGFLDFRALAQRRFYCEEEIRLNKPFCPEVYVDVVPIVEDGGLLRFGGDGTPLEYAVRMRRFDQAMRLDAQLDAGSLTIADMRELANVIAMRHRAADRLDNAERQRAVKRVGSLAMENFPPLQGSVDDSLVDELRSWTQNELDLLEPLLWRRFDEGLYRECHGDLHLANLVRLPSGIAAFDCLEFSAELRNTDVMADVAFLVMDLAVRRELAMASHFLNRYLEVSGDYGGMRVFNLYFTYRCLVRAKVAVIRSQERSSVQERHDDLDEARRYCELAHRQSKARRRVLVTMNGLSGSGKSWVSGRVMDAVPAIRIRSDIERKRMFGLEEHADSKSAIGHGMYSDEATARLYGQLNEHAGSLLDAGHNVILDASFLRHSERDGARRVAEQTNSAFCQLQVIASESMLRQRLQKRSQEQVDASEAGLRVLEHQLAHAEALTDDEQERAIQMRSDDFDAVQVADEIRRRVVDQ